LKPSSEFIFGFHTCSVECNLATGAMIVIEVIRKGEGRGRRKGTAVDSYSNAKLNGHMKCNNRAKPIIIPDWTGLIYIALHNQHFISYLK
jgi:hypothetical protein